MAALCLGLLPQELGLADPPPTRLYPYTLIPIASWVSVLPIPNTSRLRTRAVVLRTAGYLGCSTQVSVTTRRYITADLSLAAPSFGRIQVTTTETHRIEIFMALQPLPSTSLGVSARLRSLFAFNLA